MKHSSNQLQARTLKILNYGVLKAIISLVIFMTELTHRLRLIKTLHNCADSE